MTRYSQLNYYWHLSSSFASNPVKIIPLLKKVEDRVTSKWYPEMHALCRDFNALE